MLRAIIVDDQEIERFHLKVMLKHVPDIEVVAECADKAMAVKAINDTQPDVVFLDIDLGQDSGFDVLPMMTTKTNIVFVTLYNEYAVRAFDVNALDYLVKPITIERIKETLSRLQHEVGQREYLSETILTHRDMIHLQEGGRQALVEVGTIVAIESDGDYTRVHTEQTEPFLMRRRMKEWLTLLPIDNFVALDRKLIISGSHLLEIKTKTSSKGVIRLRSVDTDFMIGKTALKEAKQLMKMQGR